MGSPLKKICVPGAGLWRRGLGSSNMKIMAEGINGTILHLQKFHLEFLKFEPQCSQRLDEFTWFIPDDWLYIDTYYFMLEKMNIERSAYANGPDSEKLIPHPNPKNENLIFERLLPHLPKKEIPRDYTHPLLGNAPAPEQAHTPPTRERVVARWRVSGCRCNLSTPRAAQ